MTAVRLSPRSAVAKGAIYAYLRPRIAMDSAVPDIDPIAVALGKKSYDRARVATMIRQATAGVMAKDADLDDVQEVLETLAPYLNLEKEEDTDDMEPNSAFPMAGETEEDGWDRRAEDARRRMGHDETPEEREDREDRQSAEDAKRRLGRDETAEECARREEAMDARFHRRAEDRRRVDDSRRADDARRLGRDETPEEKAERMRAGEAEDRRRADDRKRARDARRAEDRRRADDTRREADDKHRADDARREADDKRRADDARREADDKRRADDARHKTAMDAAIRDARRVERDIAAAREEVRPWVGALPLTMAFDAAPDVYKKALDMLAVDTAGIDPSAYRAILRLVPTPGSGSRQRMATDALPTGIRSVADRFPDAARIRVMG